MKRLLAGALVATVALLALPGAPSAGQTAAAPGNALEPASSGGLVALDRLLKRLGTHRRLLVIGAHPDDEDTRLLTLVSQQMGGEAAYLSLSRGEGGQNLIGPDLGVALGLIRTQELLAARRLDGARQFFTRAYDFGYTRSIDETFLLWPKEVLLEDAARVVRRFRPQVVVSVFSGTSRDGHGQHQAAGIVATSIAREEPAGHSQLASEGLLPWRPRATYRSTYFDPDSSTILLPTGTVDPLTGRSYNQIAMASRSLHRSQDMGMLQLPGPSETRVAWLEGGAGRDAKDLFAGVDTRLTAIAGEIVEPTRRGPVEERLRRVDALVSQARSHLAPPSLFEAAAPLAAALGELRAARELLRSGDDAAAAFLDEKIALAETALATAAGITVESVADRETAAPGEALEVKVSLWNAGEGPAAVEAVELVSPDGWEIAPGNPELRTVAPGTLSEWTLKASPAGEVPTVPYFLKRPMQGALYDWSGAAPAVRGEPFQPAPLAALVRLRIAEARIALRRDVVYRFRDQALGEIRRPVRAVPLVEISVEPDRIVWPTAQKRERRLEVTLTSGSGQALAGNVEVRPPAGWPAIPPKPFSLSGRGDRAFIDVMLVPPSPLREGQGTFRVEAVLPDGRRFASVARVLDYPHVPPTPIPEASEVEVVAADIRLPALKRVGYIRGASDRVPEALAAIGVPIEVLEEKQIETSDLSRHDVIVVGSRAYETEPALTASNGRLLDYARNGGLLLVQYQQYPFIEGNFAPYKIEIARPHDRVTDETAPVRELDPNSPVFTTPNRIGAEDWAGWVQERGLYFAHTWDAAYAPLLAMNDPDQPEQHGSLLVAKLGKGLYVYTGLAFFRQLPAGVPGAYRLFANLLGLRSIPARATDSRRIPTGDPLSVH